MSERARKSTASPDSIAQAIVAGLEKPTSFVYREQVTTKKGQMKPATEVKYLLDFAVLFRGLHELSENLVFSRSEMLAGLKLLVDDAPDHWGFDKLSQNHKNDWIGKMDLRLRSACKDIGQAQSTNKHTPWLVRLLDGGLDRPRWDPSALKQPATKKPIAEEAWICDWSEKTGQAFRKRPGKKSLPEYSSDIFIAEADKGKEGALASVKFDDGFVSTLARLPAAVWEARMSAEVSLAESVRSKWSEAVESGRYEIVLALQKGRNDIFKLRWVPIGPEQAAQICQIRVDTYGDKELTLQKFTELAKQMIEVCSQWTPSTRPGIR